MAQVLQKSYECLTCHKPIRITKIDNVLTGQKKKWEKYELDGVRLHVCRHPKQQQSEQSAATEPEKQPVASSDLSKEVAAIKAQLLVLVSRLDQIEQEMTEH
jgi:hypothetical protein